MNTYSSLAPQPDPSICPNDCISGRHNEGNAALSFVGGDPVIRVGRFGLRAAGTTLLQFDVGGTQGELGLTSPFAPTKQPNVDTVDPTQCVAGGPTPNLTATRIETLRDLIRNIAPPMQDSGLYENPPTDPAATVIQQGATLFGLDLDAFRDRMTADDVDPADFDDDTNHAIANTTSSAARPATSPSSARESRPRSLAARRTSRTAGRPSSPNLLIPQNPEVPYSFEQQWANARPRMIDPKSCAPTCNPTQTIAAPYPFSGNVSRNLADYALPPAVTGLALGSGFRTPPLMGFGRVGPPFGHDARIYLNVIGQGNYPGQQPNPPAEMQFTSADGGTVVQPITTMDLAVLAAIEMHDLPAPPVNPATKAPDYELCPIVASTLDVCTRASAYRGEARNTMEKFHALTQAEQLAVVRFLEAL